MTAPSERRPVTFGLVIPSLRERGGAERMILAIAGELSRRGTPTVVFELDGVDEPGYPVPEGVPVVSLRSRRPGRQTPRTVLLLRDLRREVLRRRVDVVGAAMPRAMRAAALSLPGTGVPVVMMERGNPDARSTTLRGAALDRLVRRPGRTMTVMTRDHADELRARHPRLRVLSIPNHLDPALREALQVEAPRCPVVLGLGRLTRQKGFDVLVRAFARSGIAPVGWRLRIVGAGDQRELRELARVEGVEEHVEILGRTDRPEHELRTAGIVAVPSRWEGFGNVLLEALTAGAPVVTTDFRHGARELVEDGVSGLIVRVDDAEDLSVALRRLASDPPLRRRLGARARSVADRHDPSVVIPEWERLVAGLARS